MDIFSIKKSKLREDLLTLYFANPDNKYYLRELERILNYSVGNIRRELIKLENTGLFLSENKGNQVYYYLNQSYLIFNELKNIILEKKLQREINYTLYSKDEFEKKKDKENPFILDIIQGKKIILIGNEDEL